MSTVTSINANPPPRSSRGGFHVLGGGGDAQPRLGAILSVRPEELAQAVGTAAAAGCAVMFSPTSDGGAMGVIVYAGDQRHKGWASTVEEFQALLKAVEDVAEAHMVGGPSKTRNGPLQAR